MAKLHIVVTSAAVAILLGAGGLFAQDHSTHHPPPQPQPTTGSAQPQKPEAPAAPQHDHGQMPMTGALGIPQARQASGTSRLPDRTPMYAVHRQFGDWSAMLHENLFFQYIDEGTRRGDNQLGSANWVMGMAERRVRGGSLGLRTMLSLEPLTVGECGYPDLLATGEFCEGRPLHDRQHPHDFVMEAAALWEREVTSRVAVQFYAALAGEPTLGPVAYPHRISALTTPLAPLTHHWLDSTHISYGVLSGGVFGRQWKAEASAFNGREPDEQRFDLDLAALDSFAARFWFVPTDRLSLQVSRGHLNEAERPQCGGPRRDVDRTTASAGDLRGPNVLLLLRAAPRPVSQGSGEVPAEVAGIGRPDAVYSAPEGTMTRVIALTIVLGLTAVPLVGRMLCGAACVPAAAQPVGCHNHPSDGDPVATLSYTHTCDHVSDAAPVVLQPASWGAMPQAAAAVLPAPARLLTAGACGQRWEFPPGARHAAPPSRTAVLRI